MIKIICDNCKEEIEDLDYQTFVDEDGKEEYYHADCERINNE